MAIATVEPKDNNYKKKLAKLKGKSSIRWSPFSGERPRATPPLTPTH